MQLQLLHRPDPVCDRRQVVGFHMDDCSRSSGHRDGSGTDQHISSNMRQVMRGDELDIFKSNFEASMEAKYKDHLQFLRTSLEQTLVERDTN